ncbi:MAG: hypothetical protein AAGJ81_05395 [Verrucomicrobiota bacterium]
MNDIPSSYLPKPLPFLGMASLLGAAATSNGAIQTVNTPISAFSVGGSDTTPWNIDGGATSETEIAAYVDSATSLFRSAVVGNITANGFELIATTISNQVVNFAGNPSFIIGPTLTNYAFGPNSFGKFYATPTTTFLNGTYFSANSTGVFGFRFNSGGDTFYGRAEVLFEFPNFPTESTSVTIQSWAWNDVADEPILSGGTAVPEPADAAKGLGLLALGAAGLSRWRRSRHSSDED